MRTRQKFIPERGKIYQNQGGGRFLCLQSDDNTNAVMQNIVSKWTFMAKGCAVYPDETIDWDHSTDGFFAK
jgi:hypothetical protein